MLVIENNQTITAKSPSILLEKEEFDAIQKNTSTLEQENSNLKLDIQYFKQELENLKRFAFGKKSERFVPSVDQNVIQLTLPFEVVVRPVEETEAETETITYTKKKSNKTKQNSHSRSPLPENLPRQDIIIEPDIDLTGAKKIGEIITEVLEYIPGKLFVNRFIRSKYVFPEEGKIVTAELPPLPIPRGNAGPSLLAHLIISKYVDHLPFYRQAQQFKRYGYDVADSTINDWFNASCNLLMPLYGCLRQQVQSSNYLMGDETPIKVLTKDKPGATHRGFHWVYLAPHENIICFEYQKGRGREGPKEFLKDFNGILQTDGYGVYDYFDTRPGITLLACMAHARRKFDESLTNDPALASWMMKKMQDLYSIEEKARVMELSFDDRKLLRQKESLPILKEMEEWMKDQQIKLLPKSSIGKAVNYTLSLWHRLVRYIDDGKCEIDNNLVENSIRPVALGRKNYLFAGSHEAAQRAAMIYSFMGTCKRNGVEPLEWLTDVLSRINACKVNQLDQLLPNFRA